METLSDPEPRGHHESGGDDPLPFTICPVQQRRMDEGTDQLEGFSIHVKRWPNRGSVDCQLPNLDGLGASLFRLSSCPRPLDLDPSTRSWVSSGLNRPDPWASLHMLSASELKVARIHFHFHFHLRASLLRALIIRVTCALPRLQSCGPRGLPDGCQAFDHKEKSSAVVYLIRHPIIPSFLSRLIPVLAIVRVFSLAELLLVSSS